MNCGEIAGWGLDHERCCFLLLKKRTIYGLIKSFKLVITSDEDVLPTNPLAINIFTRYLLH
jgi:hypothetical protein